MERKDNYQNLVATQTLHITVSIAMKDADGSTATTNSPADIGSKDDASKEVRDPEHQDCPTLKT